MKKLNTYIYMLFIAVGISSCTDDIIDSGLPDEGNSGIGNYYFIISDGEPGSRSVYENITTTRFEQGDELGVFALNQDGTPVAGQKPNARYRVKDIENIDPTKKLRQVLEAATPSDELAKGCGKYLFYYPYDKSVKTLDEVSSYRFSVAENQNEQKTKDTYEKSDLLWDVAVPSGNCVNIFMDHAMANIIVEIDEKLLDAADGVTLLAVRNTADNVDLTSGTLEYMREHPYKVNDTETDIAMWDFDYASDGAKQFRAAVPACVTLDSGTGLIKITQNGEEKIFTLKNSVILEPGKNYIFHIRKKTDSVIPDITEDDSWVLDVLDPETGESVGVLCREYIRFQPHLMDDIMGREYITGTATKNPDGSDTKCISSQAWVFYPLKDYVNKIPDLDEGTVLRFIYDLNYDRSGHPKNPEKMTSCWPYPHRYGQPQHSAQGMYLPEHGHYWTNINGYGVSSTDYEEYYMHGGKITWDERNGTVGDASSDYYYISSFEMPRDDAGDPLKITNDIAKAQGHIAIMEDGTAEVSYDDLVNGSIRDHSGNKVGVVVPHYLVDRRKGNDGTLTVTKYPLVKIGYNNIWMSKNLRADTLNDGTPLECFNDPSKPNRVSFNLQTDDLGPGYLYNHYEGEVQGQKVYHDCYTDIVINGDAGKFEEQSLLYNSTVLRSGRIIPESKDERFIYRLPVIDNMNRIMMYFGQFYIGKLMSSDAAARTSQGSYSETLQTAIDRHANITDVYHFYTPNISGLNLLPTGMFDWNGYVTPDRQNYCLWLEDGVGNDAYILNFMAHHSWNTTPGLSTTGGENQIINFGGSWLGHAMYSQIFCQIRFVVKFKQQRDTQTGLMIKSRSALPHSSPKKKSCDVYVGLSE